MVKVNFTKDKAIPVEIGPLNTEFVYDDAALDSIIKGQEKLNDIIKKYQAFSDEKMPENFSMKEMKKDIQNVTDVFLGRGSFKTLYDFCPSTIKIARAVLDAMDLIMDEITNGITKTE